MENKLLISKYYKKGKNSITYIFYLLIGENIKHDR